jgi:hypothetical protein
MMALESHHAAVHLGMGGRALNQQGTSMGDTTMRISHFRRPAALGGVLLLGLALTGCASMCGVRAGGQPLPPPPPQAGPQPRGPWGGPPPGPGPGFREALQACAQAQGVTLPAPPEPGAPSGKGEPPHAPLADADREKLDACLAGKGFERPMGPPPGGPEGGAGGPGGFGPGPGGPGPMGPHHGPRDPAFAEAFKACAADQGVQLPAPGEGAREGADKAPPKLDRSKLDACLEQKGIAHPKRREGDGEGKRPEPAAAQ